MLIVGPGSSSVSTPVAKESSINLAQVAGTYDLFIAVGDVMLLRAALYCVSSGTRFTSCSIQTDDTIPLVLLSAADGVRAEWVGGKNMGMTWTQLQAVKLASGKKIRYSLLGPLGGGSARLSLSYLPMTPGATL